MMDYHLLNTGLIEGTVQIIMLIGMVMIAGTPLLARLIWMWMHGLCLAPIPVVRQRVSLVLRRTRRR